MTFNLFGKFTTYFLPFCLNFAVSKSFLVKYILYLQVYTYLYMQVHMQIIFINFKNAVNYIIAKHNKQQETFIKKIDTEKKQHNGGSTNLKTYLDKILLDKPISFQSNIIGIILIATGIIYFYNPTPLNVRIGITSILIGIFMISFITGKTTQQKITDTQLAFIIIAWIAFIFAFTVMGHLNLELFIILIFIGLLVIKELSSGYITSYIKERLNIFVLLFIIIFILIVAKKIMDITGL